MNTLKEEFAKLKEEFLSHVDRISVPKFIQLKQCFKNKKDNLTEYSFVFIHNGTNERFTIRFELNKEDSKLIDNLIIYEDKILETPFVDVFKVIKYNHIGYDKLVTKHNLVTEDSLELMDLLNIDYSKFKPYFKIV
jgi:hypothetical protein